MEWISGGTVLSKMNLKVLCLVLVLFTVSLAYKTLTENETIARPTLVPTPPTDVLPSPISRKQIEPDVALEGVSEAAGIEGEFPLPEDVQNFIRQSEDGINFQTGMTQDEAVDYYPDAFNAQGLSERYLLTVIEEDVFSLVFDGAPNGRAVVVQGVRLDNGVVNINIRYDDN